jgi:WS/DGAT/MGAT family acyltransferase
MKRLNGWDAMLLYSEAPNIHTHTLKIAVVDVGDFADEFTFSMFRRALWRRLHLLEPLRYQLVEIPWNLHHPMWLQNCAVDLDYHVRRVRLPGPGGRRELDQLAGQIASAPLDRRRPLWEMYFVEGMPGDRFAVVVKVHHALADGVASANLLARAMDLAGPTQDEREPVPADPMPSRGQLLRAAAREQLHEFGALPGLIKETGQGIWRMRRQSRRRGELQPLGRKFNPPTTFINHVVSPGRRFATATLALSDVKQTSRKLGVTINDVVLATAAGGLRELLLRYDGRADEPILAAVPAALDLSPQRLTGNELSGLNVWLPVDSDDPLERARLTALAAAIAKEDFHLLGPRVAASWAAYLPAWAAPAAFRWLSNREGQNKILNLPISSVPGPRQRGRVVGATIGEFYSVGPLVAGAGMNITVWSYVDQLNISVLTDDKTLDDPHEATDEMINSFAEIRSAAGLSGELSGVDTAMARASAHRAPGTV